MGREIRRVPADWKHPKYTRQNAPYENRVGEYIPLYDEDFDAAAEEWLADLDLWRSGKHEAQGKPYAKGYKYFWEYSGAPPVREAYRDRKWTEEEATHFQVYETVSEGTPITPPCASKEALIEYLVTQGDFWRGKWLRESAEQFVKDEYAPSMIVANGRVMTPENMTE